MPAGAAHQRQAAALSSLPEMVSGPQTGVKVPDDQYKVQVDYMPTGAPKTLCARLNTDTHQSRAIAVVLGNPRDHEHPVTEEAHPPMMSFGSKPSSDNCSCSQTCQTSDAKMLIVKPQEEYKTSQRHGERELLGTWRCYACDEILPEKKLIWTK